MQVYNITKIIKKLPITLILLIMFSCKKEDTKSTNPIKQETQWCYRNEPCITKWPDMSCVPSSAIDEIKNAKDSIVKDKNDSIILIKYEFSKTNIKRGEPPGWGGKPGIRVIKYECGK